MIAYLVFSTMCLFVFLGVYKFALRSSRHYRLARAYLLASLTAGLVIPIIPFSSGGNEVTSVVLDSVVYGITAPVEYISMAAADMPGRHIALVLYLLVSAVLFIRLLLNLKAVSKYREGGHWHIHRGTRYFRTAFSHQPFSFFNTIYIPGSHPYGDTALTHILAHEKMHVRAGHSYDRVGIEMLIILFWLNPLLYLYRNALLEVHECAADLAVAKQTNRRSYLRTLMCHLEMQDVHGFGHAFFQSNTDYRITNLTNMKDITHGKWKYLLFFPLVLFLTVLNACREEAAIQKQDFDGKQDIAMNSEPADNNSDVYRVVDQMPAFPGCSEASGGEVSRQQCTNQKLAVFLGQNLVYPEAAKNANVEGRVIIQFVVDESGNVTDVGVVEGIGYGCDEEARRVVEKMNTMDIPWTPGMHRNEAVKVMYTLPIVFKLPSGE